MLESGSHVTTPEQMYIMGSFYADPEWVYYCRWTHQVLLRCDECSLFEFDEGSPSRLLPCIHGIHGIRMAYDATRTCDVRY